MIWKMLLQYDQLNKSQIKFISVYKYIFVKYNLVLKRLVTMISKNQMIALKAPAIPLCQGEQNETTKTK